MDNEISDFNKIADLPEINWQDVDQKLRNWRSENGEWLLNQLK